MQAVVSMRLHALIFAAGQGIPLAGVVYDPKVSAFLRYIGQENFLDLDALTADALKAMIDCMVSSPISRRNRLLPCRSCGRSNRSMWTRPAAYLGNKLPVKQFHITHYATQGWPDLTRSGHPSAFHTRSAGR